MRVKNRQCRPDTRRAWARAIGERFFVHDPVSTFQWLLRAGARGGFADFSPLLYVRYLSTVAALATVCYPAGSRKWWTRRVKLVGLSALRARAVRAWLEAIGTCALMQRVMAARPMLLERPYRPLGRTGLRFHDRMGLLREHYDTMHRLVPTCVSERIYLGGGLEWRVDDRYMLRLADSGPNPKEGELAFYWIDSERDVCLTQLSFYLKRGKQGPEIFVGGLQGPMGEDSRDLIRESTKACDGLRPKDAVMEALFAFAGHVGARRIVAVSRRNHVGLQRHTPRVIHADYDGFWMESGGAVLPCGNVEVPVWQPRRDVMELPSKKRSAYRRKQARADGIRGVVREWLEVPGAAAGERGEAMPVAA